VSAVRLLYLAAAALLATGVALRIVPLRPITTDSVPRAPASVGDGSTAVPVQAGSAVHVTAPDPILSADIFTPSRAAPPRPATEQVRNPKPRTVTTPHEPTVKLFGTTIGPDGAVALIDFPGHEREAHLYRIGDTLAGARLTAITDSTVTLVRGSTALLLRLPPVAASTP